MRRIQRSENVCACDDDDGDDDDDDDDFYELPATV